MALPFSLFLSSEQLPSVTACLPESFLLNSNKTVSKLRVEPVLQFFLLTTLRLSRGAPVTPAALGDSNRTAHISSSIVHEVPRGRVCQIWSRGTAPSMTGHSCLCSPSAVTYFGSRRQGDAFSDLPAHMCMYTEFHTHMHNLPAWLHLAVHITHTNEAGGHCDMPICPF